MSERLAACYKCKKQFPNKRMYMDMVDNFSVDPNVDNNLFILGKFTDKETKKVKWVVTACEEHTNKKTTMQTLIDETNKRIKADLEKSGILNRLEK